MKRLLRCSVLGTGAGFTWWQIRHQQSVAVQEWRPSPLPRRRAGPLHVRTAGSGSDTVVLLHGLVATGDIFGSQFDRLAADANLVVPDLLGFGRSLDEERSRFCPDDHLDALDASLDELGLTDRPLRIGAHSMGASLAMRWLQRGTANITSVACFGPPVYRNSHAIDSTIAESGLMARAFVANTKWAQTACHLNCAHRRLAGIVAAAASPQHPTRIAQSSSLHTWPAYRDAMDRLVRSTEWGEAMAVATDKELPITFMWGEHDHIGDRDFASTFPGVAIHTVPGAGHHLPMTHPEHCLARLAPVSPRKGRRSRQS